MTKKIDFPAEEQEELKNRSRIITTRVSQEYNVYHPGEMLETPWHACYMVMEVKKISNVKDHPYYDNLTKSQIQLISKYKKIDIVILKKVKTA